ncbi:fimbria/pilus periplasmic chaperone [Fusobacterium mortiferum]|jgi:P pilus assembly chaperone PapD|uniref:fimbria/pilus periplasmic chaperone n=1 Tax=Fusobacterium mortiferum TaxID=850 RepID=UPI001F3CEB02|nr:fimbria/pilus periplasmic chaperone [Fusobacterium mortiferum]MCF2627840.1 fimbria/pilus periplasmic chaperone [Fusobacterium mortiferum]MDD7261059.1 fimbria/pilus periplasmic chaperone [Fusobacterium mortiferum]MDY5979896.1 fimbria/pilus periplasmic chaperone [Fusobacterium mortiferum]
MKKIITLCLFIIIGTLSFALNFTIYPTKFEVDLSKSSTQEMYIVNNTDSPLRVGIAPESDKKFGENYNLNSNIKVFPKVVSVKPAGKQIVRFRVIPDKNLKDGEYKSYITFTEIPAEIKRSEEVSENISSEVQMITAIMISVYGVGENSTIDGGIKNISTQFENEILTISANSYSKGNTSLKFDYVINGKNIKSEGRLGISARTGNSNITTSINLSGVKKGEKITLTIKDQTGKVYYNKNITL